MSDASARRTAVRSFDRNLVVVAGAGTGKTSLLIERLLNQLIERDLDVSEIAAITFTEKAAAELRSRLETGLARLSALARADPASNPIDERFEADRAYAYLSSRVSARALSERTERLLAQIAQANIGTIHGYCAGLLRQFPAESGVDPDFAIDEGPLFDALREELWEELLSGRDGPEGPRGVAWRAVLRRLDPGELRELAWQLASFELPGERARLAPTSELLGPIVHEQLRANASARGAGGRGPESYLAAADPVLRAYLAGPDAFRAALAGARFASARGPRGLLESAAPTARNAPDAQRCARNTRRLLERLERVDDELFRTALDLLGPFVERVFEESRRRNVLPFGALLLLTRDLLADHPEVRRELGRRLELLLVDEFQDTDPLQYEIVFFLAEDPSGPPAARAFETRLAPGALFIVGDPKQAIYRFRGADMASYHRAVEHVLGCGGEQLALTQSFRAPPELLEPLDRLFPPLLRAQANQDASAYSGYDSLRSGRPRAGSGPHIEVWTVGSDAERSAERARRDEAEAVASWLVEESRSGRVDLGGVAMLFRASSSVPAYAGALRDRGIPHALETGRDLLKRPEGQQLAALLRALANPSDAPAVLAVLRSALGGVADTELAAYAASAAAMATAWSYVESAPDPERFPGVARTYAFLCKWYGASLRIPLDSLLSELVEEACLLPLHAAAADGAQRVANLHSRLDPLIELARRDSRHTLGSLLPWIERIERPIGPPARRGDELAIMTIHASKGLEFPLVILPDLARSPSAGARREAATELRWLRETASLAIRTLGPLSAGALVREAEEARHETAENRRLFYVACTRAAERLVLVHAPRARVSTDAPVRHLAPWSYPVEGLPAGVALVAAPDVRHRYVGAAGELRPLARETGIGNSSAAVARTRRVAAHARASAAPAFRHPTGLREQADARLEVSEGEPGLVSTRTRAGGIALAVGSVLHEVLERWDFQGADTTADLLRRALARVRRDGGVDPKELERQSERALGAFLESDLPGYLAALEVLGREVPVLFEDEEGICWSGTIDLLYRDPDGRLVVADYKTDRAPDPETHERYRAQLEVYGRGVARAFPRAAPPALELLYLQTGERLRL